MAQPRYKIVVSDCHLSAGRYFEGRLNPHEDFSFDNEMCELFDYYSSGEYGKTAEGGDVEVELVIAGDFLDFLNVPIDGDFDDFITEERSLTKLDAILKGHPRVMEAIRRFASKPMKTVTYLIGNHDADLFWPKVQEAITRAWDPEGRYPSPKVSVVNDRDRLVYPEGLEIHHGNQFEAGSQIDFESPFLSTFRDQAILNLPWSSIYVLKIVNRLKWEREFLDKVRPVKSYLVLGLLMDPGFTLKFLFLSLYYFLKTRITWSPKRRTRLKNAAAILRQESRFFQDLDGEAREYLDQNPHVKTLIFGHTHRPMDKIYPDGRQYINTGTWTKMINLDLKSWGQQLRLTFAHVELSEGKAHCELRQWQGLYSPYRGFLG